MVRWPLVALTAIAATLLFGSAALAGGGCHAMDSTTSQARGTSIDITQCKFAPVVLFAPVGTTITWAAHDQVPHNVVGLGWGSTDLLQAGLKMQNAFTTPGIYPYHCTLHPDMSGVVIVGDVDLSGASSPVAANAPDPSALVAGAVASAPQQPRDNAAIAGAGAAAVILATGLAFLLGRRMRSTA